MSQVRLSLAGSEVVAHQQTVPEDFDQTDAVCYSAPANDREQVRRRDHLGPGLVVRGASEPDGAPEAIGRPGFIGEDDMAWNVRHDEHRVSGRRLPLPYDLADGARLHGVGAARASKHLSGDAELDMDSASGQR